MLFRSQLGFAALTWEPVASYSAHDLIPGTVTAPQKELAVRIPTLPFSKYRRLPAPFFPHPLSQNVAAHLIAGEETP